MCPFLLGKGTGVWPTSGPHQPEGYYESTRGTTNAKEKRPERTMGVSGHGTGPNSQGAAVPSGHADTGILNDIAHGAQVCVAGVPAPQPKAAGHVLAASGCGAGGAADAEAVQPE